MSNSTRETPNGADDPFVLSHHRPKNHDSIWVSGSILLHVLLIGSLLLIPASQELFTQDEEPSTKQVSMEREKVEEIIERVREREELSLQEKLEQLLQYEEELADLEQARLNEFDKLAEQMEDDAVAKAEDAAKTIAEMQQKAVEEQQKIEQLQQKDLPEAEKQLKDLKEQWDKKIAQADAKDANAMKAAARQATDEARKKINELVQKVAQQQEKVKDLQTEITEVQSKTQRSLDFASDAHQPAKDQQLKAAELQHKANVEQQKATQTQQDSQRAETDEARAKTERARAADALDKAKDLKDKAEKELARQAEALPKAQQEAEKTAEKQDEAAKRLAEAQKKLAEVKAKPDDAKDKADAVKKAEREVQHAEKQAKSQERAETSAEKKAELSEKKKALAERQLKEATTRIAQAEARLAKATEAEKQAAKEKVETKAQAKAGQTEAKKKQVEAQQAQAKADAERKKAPAEPQKTDMAKKEDRVKPVPNVPAKATTAELYDKAVQVEKRVAERARNVKAADTAVKLRIPLTEATRMTELPLTKRPEVDKKLLEKKISTPTEAVAHRKEVEKVQREVDSITASVETMLMASRNAGVMPEGMEASLAEIEAAADMAAEMKAAALEDEGAKFKDLAELMKKADEQQGKDEGKEEGEQKGEDKGAGQAQAGGALPAGGKPGRGQYPWRWPQGGDVNKRGKAATRLAQRSTDAETTDHGWVYVDTWYTIGPFPNPARRNIDTQFPPESVIDLDATCIGDRGQKLRWHFLQSKRVMVLPYDARPYGIYYAYTELHFDQETDAIIAVGSDDNSRLWINGHLVWMSGRQLKSWKADEGFRKVHFRKGVNRVLCRVENRVARGGVLVDDQHRGCEVGASGAERTCATASPIDVARRPWGLPLCKLPSRMTHRHTTAEMTGCSRP